MRRHVIFLIAALFAASACTSSSTSSSSSSPIPTSASSSPAPVTTLANGHPLPSDCTGTARASQTVAFVAEGRAWALDPATHRLTCLFTTSDPGPFTWGPQGDRVLLGDFQIEGLDPEAPTLAAPSPPPVTFDWGHPIGVAIVFTSTASKAPEKLFTEDGHVEGLPGLPSGRYLQIAYHPSGLALGFILQRGDKQSIWISTNEGQDPQRLVFANPGTRFTSIAFSPDGKQLWWTAEHSGVPVLHRMDLGNRSTFNDVWQGASGSTAGDLRIAPDGLLKSLNVGTTCANRQALVVAGGSASRAMPFETRPTTALGWLDDSTVLVAAGGCDQPTELFAVDAHVGGHAVALVTGVEQASPRTVLEDAPTSVPAPGSADIEAPPGGLG
jgi:hypothetical protein